MLLFVQVKSAVQHAHTGFPIDGMEAMSLVAMLQLSDSLQINLKNVIKEDSDWLRRFMPVAEMVNYFVFTLLLIYVLFNALYTTFTDNGYACESPIGKVHTEYCR